MSLYLTLCSFKRTRTFTGKLNKQKDMKTVSQRKEQRIQSKCWHGRPPQPDLDHWQPRGTFFNLVWLVDGFFSSASAPDKNGLKIAYHHQRVTDRTEEAETWEAKQQWQEQVHAGKRALLSEAHPPVPTEIYTVSFVNDWPDNNVQTSRQLIRTTGT